MPKFTTINSWDEFSPLKTVFLGSVFDPEFFNDIKNNKIEYVLKKVFEETIEDLDNFKSTLESHGIKVHQATPNELGYQSSIMDYIDQEGRIGWLYPFKDEARSEFLANNDVTRNNLIPAPP